MDGVIGLTVMVKLKQPPNAILYGVVDNVVPNSHLALRNVFSPENYHRWEQLSLQLSIIDDLEVVDPSRIPSHPQAQIHMQQPPVHFRQAPTLSQPQAPPPPSFPPASIIPMRPASIPAPSQPSATSNVPLQQPPQPHTHTHPEQPLPQPPQQPSLENTSSQQQSRAAFVDPAILSYGTSPVRARRSPPRNNLETPIKSMLARAAQNLPSPGSPFIGDVSRTNVAQKLAAAARPPPTNGSAQQAPRNGAVPAGEAAVEDTLPVAPTDPAARKKVRKPKKKEASNVTVADPPPTMNTEVSRNGNDMSGAVKRGKGWRSTPLLQPSPQAGNPAEVAANTKKSRRRKDREQEFAQGDLTDIQDMGDFDFEGELKKFDKKQVFDEIRQGDTTADEDRLVSHNRVHRPGTYGGKNLHPTEPVLSPKLPSKDEADSTSDADTELNFANGRSSSRHSISRSILSKKPNRQNSQPTEGRVPPHLPHPLTTTISNRSTTSLVGRGLHAASVAGKSPRPDRSDTPPSARAAKTPTNFAAKPHETHFAIRPDMLVCPTLLPGALEALEAAAVETFGLSPDALTETAGRYIAEAAVNLSDDASIRRPSRSNTMRGSMTSSQILHPSTEQPVVVVLAGNHAVGARALAAARQLATRNYQVICAETVCDDAANLHAQRRTQVSVLRKMRAGGAPVKRGTWSRASAYIKSLAGPPAVIIDALLGGAAYVPVTDDPTAPSNDDETREMIDWANRSRAPVLSVGCPAGLDGVSGQAVLIDGEPLAVRPDRVIALGAPLQGLLRAMESGERWPVGLADVGINVALRSEEAVAFGGSWLVELEFVDGELLSVGK